MLGGDTSFADSMPFMDIRHIHRVMSGRTLHFPGGLGIIDLMLAIGVAFLVGGHNAFCIGEIIKLHEKGCKVRPFNGYMMDIRHKQAWPAWRSQ